MRLAVLDLPALHASRYTLAVAGVPVPDGHGRWGFELWIPSTAEVLFPGLVARATDALGSDANTPAPSTTGADVDGFDINARGVGAYWEYQDGSRMVAIPYGQVGSVKMLFVCALPAEATTCRFMELPAGKNIGGGR